MKFINYLNNLLKKYSYFLLFLIVGLIIFFYPMFLSGFDLMPGDSKDVKIINYILEHHFLWITQFPEHTNFWNMPFFYPLPDTLIMGDMLIGGVPIYCFLRIFLEPFSAFQIFTIIVCIINYSSFYYFLNKQLNFSPLASSAGSFLFAFSLYRYYKFPHLSYFIQFYSIWILICIFKMNKKNTILKNSILASLIAIFLAIQFTTCFTSGWAFGFFGLIAVLVSLFFKKTRKKIIIFTKRFYTYIISSIGLFFAILSPVIHKYATNDFISEPVNLHYIDQFIPDITAWFRNISLINQNLFQNLDTIPYSKTMEAMLGVGIFTSILIIVGLLKIKNKEIKKIFLIVTFLIVILSCKINDIILWEYLLNTIPGASVIRSVSRIAFISLIIFAISLANFIQYLEQKQFKKVVIKILLIFTILTFYLTEHIPLSNTSQALWKNYSWSKKEFIKEIEDIVETVDNECEAIIVQLNDNKYANKYILGKFISNEIFLQEHLYSMWITAKKENIVTPLGVTGITLSNLPIDSTKLYCNIILDKDYDSFKHKFTDNYLK